jgi:hypothetical protein
MSMSKTMRQVHRWLSVLFTAAVIFTTIALAREGPEWVSYVPLLPLGLLFLTGTYLFVLPYFSKSRSAQRSGST